MNTIKIGSFEYVRDDTNSYHRVTDREREDIFDYKLHVYIDGDFKDKNSLMKINKQELFAKFQNDAKRTDETFAVLENWDIIPTHNTNILDLGCGYGMFINQWVKKGYGKGYGVEISPLVKRISPASDNINIIDVNKIESVTISSDVSLIVAFDIIEHLFDVSNILSVIHSKIQVLTKMLIEIPIIPHDIDNTQLPEYPYLYPTRHLHLFTKQGIEREIMQAGFKINKSKLINEQKYLILIEKWKI
jgi:2-polyprenyl-3-methyl-5-hydroxy-6-metoxy-1,4-benzoquinol methylase